MAQATPPLAILPTNTGKAIFARVAYPGYYAWTNDGNSIEKDSFGDTWLLNISIFLIFIFLIVGIILLFISYDNNNSKAKKDAQEDTQILENLVKNYTNS
jgi:hypothetical protein